MHREDTIQFALSAPIDWAKFEALVFEILLQDDMPNLRKLGGVGDGGADAIEEVFFEDGRRPGRVVQATSEKTQTYKARRTIARLRQSGIECTIMVLVFRQPVSTETRYAIQTEGAQNSVVIDIRDESYLVGQLGRPKSTLFSRYFQDIRAQVEALFDEGDPLATSDERFKHAMLASLGAYVLNPHSEMARATLFDRTVLAVLVSTASELDYDLLRQEFLKVLPGETVQIDQLKASIRRLTSDHLVKSSENAFRASEKALVSIGTVLAKIKAAIDSLLSTLVNDVSARHNLDEASKGRLEKNLKAGLTDLLRRIGPSVSIQEDAVRTIEEDIHSFRQTLCDGLTDKVARTACAAMLQFARSSENRESLAILSRSYTAMEIRNLDPLGRKWQQATISRSTVYLDTDIVIKLIVRELPTHEALLKAIKGFSHRGIELIIPSAVVEEVVDHFRRAIKTFKKLESSLSRLPKEAIESKVWHALVQGFCWSDFSKTRMGFLEYWRRYYDLEEPSAFVLHHLQSSIKFQVEDLDSTIHADDATTLSHLCEEFIETEKARRKAMFRDEKEMLKRIKSDVLTALRVARCVKNDAMNRADGYVVSNDFLFQRIQTSRKWTPRPKIRLTTVGCIGLADCVCGIKISNEEFVRCVFDPMLALAASDLADEMITLAEVGVKLQETDLRRLEWDLEKDLHQRILSVRDEDQSQDSTFEEVDEDPRMALANCAKAEGYELEPAVAEVIQRFEDAAQEGERAREQNEKMSKFLDDFLELAGGQKKRNKRRLAKIIERLGGLPNTESQ
jgi:hypothetical protein